DRRLGERRGAMHDVDEDRRYERGIEAAIEQHGYEQHGGREPPRNDECRDDEDDEQEDAHYGVDERRTTTSRVSKRLIGMTAYTVWNASVSRTFTSRTNPIAVRVPESMNASLLVTARS